MNKKSHPTRIHTRLFAMLLAILLTASALYVGVLLLWQTRYHRADRLKALKSEAVSAMLQVDNALSAMNTVSLGLSYSSVVRDRFDEILESERSPIGGYRLNQSYRYLTDMLYAIIGPRLSVPQVYVYGLEGGCFGAGIDNGYKSGIGIGDCAWIDIEHIGARQHTAPHRDGRLYAAQRYEHDRLYVSLVRRFTDSLNIPQGYAEVVQRYDTVFGAIDGLLGEGRDVLVFDGTGRQVYPAGAEDGRFEAIVSIYGARGEADGWTVLPDGREMVSYTESGESDYVLALVASSAYLLSSFWPLIYGLLLALVAVSVVMLLISYLLSRGFTRPIKRLHIALTETDMENLSATFPEVETDILELRELNRMIAGMKKRLNLSTERLLLTQQHELQARVLALQAQTNPHFIYNMIFSIGAMASEGQTDEIERLCEDLGSLLRYSSGARDPVVCVGRELEYTQLYVNCMRIRFPDLEYGAEAAEELLGQAVPKLSVQLMVENAIKFCTTRRPPWHVRVVVSAQDGHVLIRIEDDGPGFDTSTLEKLRRQIDETAHSGLLPSLEINGMGILNVFFRLRLTFGDEADLRLENGASGGAVACILLPAKTCEGESEERKR